MSTRQELPRQRMRARQLRVRAAWARDAADNLREHHFCTPTVAPIPPQPPLDSADW